MARTAFPVNPGHERCGCAPTECADAALIARDFPLVARGILTQAQFEKAYGPYRACARCGGPVTSLNPDYPYCRVCHYTGHGSHTDVYGDLLEALDATPGVKWAQIHHTGGGCFGIGIEFEDGRFAFMTDAFVDEETGERYGDATLDNGPEGLHYVTLWASEESFGDGEEQDGEFFAIGTEVPTLLAHDHEPSCTCADCHGGCPSGHAASPEDDGQCFCTPECIRGEYPGGMTDTG